MPTRASDGGADFGVAGLAVMGQNLARNSARNGFRTVVFNRTTEKTDAFLAEHPGEGLIPAHSAREFAAALKRPRKLILMVKAGAPVDETIAHLLPHLSKGDVLMDGGNSNFKDTERRQIELAKRGIRFLGVGISGGEEGALNGPSIMPGGDRAAYALVAPVLKAMSAKTDSGPCVTWLGKGSAGHFVKMVHNGIEYAMMQMLAESYDLMKHGLGLGVPQAQREFARWNEGRAAGYLVEITALVLNYTDPETGKPLVELILDTAAQKGTGKWTTVAALDLGVPVPAISAAVDARIVSGHKVDRIAVAKVLPARPRKLRGLAGPSGARALEGAAYAGFLVAYAQGMHLLKRASGERDYGLNLAEVSRIWKGGCIVRSRILEIMRRSYVAAPRLEHLFLSPLFRKALVPDLARLRTVVAAAAAAGIPTPALGAALAYTDALGRSRLPANLTQAQRDHFGAHTYERIDKPGVFHTKWD